MKYKVVVLFTSIAVALLLHFTEVLAMLDAGSTIQVSQVATEVCYLLCSMMLLFALNFRIFHFNQASAKIGWVQIVASVVVIFIVNQALGHAFVRIYRWLNLPAIDSQLHHYLHPLRDTLIAIIVTATSYILHISRKGQSVEIENEKLRTQNVTSQYEALKNQLNPHMLFNTLSTLSSLINESPEKAQTFTHELAKVMRYTLQNDAQNGVTLGDEISFLNSYIYILKSRYEDNLTFDIDIDSSLREYRLPSMTLQLLVENSVKHNEISDKHNLLIKIYSSENNIVVENQIRPKITKYIGGGIGLANLSRRYDLLFGQSIVIARDLGLFRVTIPLVNTIDK